MAPPLSVYMFTDTDAFGGAERALLTLIEGLDRGQWQPTLVYHAGNGVAPLLEAARDLEVELWPIPPMPEGLTGAARVPRFAAQLRSRRPAVFHAHLTWPMACKFGLVGAVLARVPAILATEQSFVEFRIPTASRVQQQVLGAFVDRYVSVSHHVASRLQETLGLPRHKVEVIPNAIDLERFRGEPDPVLRARLSRGEALPVVLSTARLVQLKGLTVLLDAACEVPEARFVIAGCGPERESLEARARELGLGGRVEFLGYRDDVPQLLACSDLAVLPSLSEGLPLAALEAMAAERPIVATAAGGTAEAVLDGETGLLVPPGDATALAGAIRALLADQPRARRLAAAGRARVKQAFSSEQMTERVTHIYAEVLGARAGRMRRV